MSLIVFYEKCFLILPSLFFMVFFLVEFHVKVITEKTFSKQSLNNKFLLIFIYYLVDLV